jgi:hypothetical protein
MANGNGGSNNGWQSWALGALIAIFLVIIPLFHNSVMADIDRLDRAYAHDHDVLVSLSTTVALKLEALESEVAHLRRTLEAYMGDDPPEDY